MIAGLTTGAKRSVRPIACLALTLCVAVTAMAADPPEVIFSRADKLDREGKTARAIEEYRAYLDSYPGHSQVPEGRYRLAKCLDGVGHVDDAVKELELATSGKYRRFRKRQDALYLLGKLLGEQKEHERAVKAFEQLLGEGAGLYEEEVLNRCGGYYAILKQYDEAAAKFNILKRRKNSRLAERAAYKLALIWLEARNIELAVDAVGDLATRFPSNQEARGLMLRLANILREQRKFDQAIAVCDQLKTRFPKTREGLAAPYVVGLCHRDRKQYPEAVKVFDAVARVPQNVKSGLSAEAMLESADILFVELNQADAAMARYEETAGLAREYGDAARKAKILEQCYFRLAEHYFAKQKWSVALEFYSLLRQVGTSINILPRIMKCQSELEMNMDAFARRDEELEYIRKKIKENPGTFAAAEGEVFLADQELARLKESTHAAEPYHKVIELYRKILETYPKTVISQYHLESYVHVQLAHCHAAIYRARREVSKDAQGWESAILEFQTATEVDPTTPYRREALEWTAQIADLAGQKELAFETYRRLYELTGEKLKESPEDEETREAMTGYLRSMLTRARDKDSVERSLQLCRNIIEKEGVASEAARHALFYMGELFYLSKHFSDSAKTFDRFVRTYGPRQTPEGELAGGPWKVEKLDEKTRQVYDAAVRVAHAWYLQGHTQNMLRSYRWIVRNIPNQNRYVAEAQYWLAMELAKGKEANSRERRRELAVTLWTKVVAPWFLDVPPEEQTPAGAQKPGRERGRRSPTPSGQYHFWVRDREMSRYVKASIVKTGEHLSGIEEHALAAGAFQAYLSLYPEPQPRGGVPPPIPDDLYRISRYALGQEYAAIGKADKLVEVYRPYLSGQRDDKFRLPGLRFLGYHASRGDLKDAGVQAYATILDEYGENEFDEHKDPIPVPKSERIRQEDYGWNGIRMLPPDDLDLGQVRYALGFLFWKNEEWEACIRTLRPFATTGALITNKFRGKSLYMLARSYYKLFQYANGIEMLAILIKRCPGFEAIEEAYVEAAKGCRDLKKWQQIHQLYEGFVKKYPQSLHRPHMDLFSGIATVYSGSLEEGARKLKTIVRSDAYEDVKAEAHLHLGLLELSIDSAAISGGAYKPTLTERNHVAALRHFTRSVELYPTETACLAAAKSHIALKEWDQARVMLGRAVSDFPTGNRAIIEQAKRLLPRVLKLQAAERDKKRS